MLKVWGRKSSSNVQAVLWCLAELGVAHERIDAGFTYGVVDTPEYRAMNPNGKVPTIRDGDGTTLFESGAILRYLAARHAPDAFWPADPAARAGVDQWAEWAKQNVAQGFTAPIFWKAVRVPIARRDPAAIAAAVRRLDEQVLAPRRRPPRPARLSRRRGVHARRHPARSRAVPLLRSGHRARGAPSPPALLRRAGRTAGLP